LPEFNFERFIEKANSVHDSKYKYVAWEARGPRYYIDIECTDHGIFVQRTDSHLKGAGCRHCVHESIPLKRSIEDFVVEASAIHKNKFDYCLVTTTKTTSKIDIICKDHGVFSQTVAHHLVSRGCPECSVQKQRLSQDDFLAKSIEFHGNKYDYSKAILTKGFTQKVIIGCPEHGEFIQSAGPHMYGNGCPKCGVERSLLQRYSEYTTEYFIERAKQIHKDKYSYEFAEYVNTETKVKIVCDVHGIFEQRPLCHVKGKGCAQCTYDKTTYNMVDRYTEDVELGQRLGSIYIIEMSDGEESFLKLGITCNKKGREKVYKRQKDIYDYSFVYEKEMINIDSANLERKIMRELKSLGYYHKPTKKFTGYTECFSNEAKDLIIKYIEEATSG
jgi:hypothetical protein